MRGAIDISTGETVLQKQHFGKAFAVDSPGNPPQTFGDLGSASVDFSPDGRFVIALPWNARGSAVAWDLHQRREVRLRGAMKKLTTLFSLETEMVASEFYSVSFAFVAPDRLIMSPHFDEISHATVATTLAAFPSGKVLATLKLPPGPLFRAADPGFVLIRPFGQYTRPDGKPRAAAVEFSSGQIIVSEAPALDVFGNKYVAELTNGGVGLYERGNGLQATVKLDELRREDP